MTDNQIVGGRTMLQRIAIVMLALFGALTGAAHSERYHKFDSGTWDAYAWRTDDSREFGQCAADEEYRNGLTVSVAVFRNYSWMLSFFNPDWPSDLDAKSVNYRFDRGKWMPFGSASALEGKLLMVSMPGESEIIRTFGTSRVLEIFFLGKHYSFKLKGTGRLLADLVKCVDYELANANDSSPPNVTQPSDSQNASGTNKNTAGSIYTGTGIWIHSAGYILTNFHVAGDCSAIVAAGVGDVPAIAELVAADKVNDLAVLRTIKGPASHATAKFRSNGLRLGETISVFGFPLSGTLATSGNFVSGSISALAGMGDDARMVQLTAPIQPGNSGGPLLDGSGYVVGIVNAKLNELKYANATGVLPQNVNFAIKSNVAQNFLDANSITYETANDNLPLASVEVAEKAQKFTAQILCKSN